MKKIRRILLLGSTGLLGRSFLKSLDNYDLSCPSRTDFDITCSSHAEGVSGFDIVINCTGYKDVNQAEHDPSLAYATNAEGVQNLAQACTKHDIPLIHFSTDYVFDGKSTTPYRETDQAAPLNFYGCSKLEGEKLLRDIMQKHLIFRTCWLYGLPGKSMLNLVLEAEKQKRDLTIVNDQIGSPTSTVLIVAALKKVLKCLEDPSFEGWGTYHLCARGQTSWYKFVQRIIKILHLSITVSPISTRAFSESSPDQAQRPLYSVLDPSRFEKKFDFECPNWEEALSEYLLQLQL